MSASSCADVIVDETSFPASAGVEIRQILLSFSEVRRFPAATDEAQITAWCTSSEPKP